MCSSNDCLIYYFFLILIFFSVFIYFLLKYRKTLLKTYLEVSADQVWDGLAKRDDMLNLSKSNLLFCVWQDVSATTVSLIVKDSKNQLVGKVLKPMGRRKQTIEMGDKVFVIEFPLTWKRTALLHAPDGGGILAKYAETGLFRHEIDIPGYGVVTSKKAGLNFKGSYDYKLKNQLIGTSQGISSVSDKGRLLILPSEIPLEIRIFILSV